MTTVDYASTNIELLKMINERLKEISDKQDNLHRLMTEALWKSAPPAQQFKQPRPLRAIMKNKHKSITMKNKDAVKQSLNAAFERASAKAPYAAGASSDDDNDPAAASAIPDNYDYETPVDECE